MIFLEVLLWGRLVGVLVWEENTQTVAFEYAPEFLESGLEVSPLLLPLAKGTSSYQVPAHRAKNDIDAGLPLFIADALPDRFGTQILRSYLERQGKRLQQLTPLEKLSYIGDRGMGALEFRPDPQSKLSRKTLDLKQLNTLSQALLKEAPIAHESELGNIFHVGTSPGGAQPKVLINIDRNTGNIYRGDRLPKSSEDSWILKFNPQKGETYDEERGKIEYAYHRMALETGIIMMPSKLVEDQGQTYFMTQRFDRVLGKKVHTQTLHAMAEMDFRQPNTYSYEQVHRVFLELQLSYEDREQLFKIMVFNVLAANVDDHTKNFGFQMDEAGKWSFSPAYDLTFTYNEHYKNVTPHFLSVNGKNLNHTLSDLLATGAQMGIKRPKEHIQLAQEAIGKWGQRAVEANISQKTSKIVAQHLGLWK